MKPESRGLPFSSTFEGTDSVGIEVLVGGRFVFAGCPYRINNPLSEESASSNSFSHPSSLSSASARRSRTIRLAVSCTFKPSTAAIRIFGDSDSRPCCASCSLLTLTYADALALSSLRAV